jgi:hypothetical protein
MENKLAEKEYISTKLTEKQLKEIIKVIKKNDKKVDAFNGVHILDNFLYLTNNHIAVKIPVENLLNGFIELHNVEKLLDFMNATKRDELEIGVIYNYLLDGADNLFCDDVDLKRSGIAIKNLINETKKENEVNEKINCPFTPQVLERLRSIDIITNGELEGKKIHFYKNVILIENIDTGASAITTLDTHLLKQRDKGE